MASHFRKLLSFTATAALSVAAPALASTVTETFTLPNGTSMGPNWTEAEGNTIIENNMGKGSSGPGGKGWMHHKFFAGYYGDSVSEVDFILTTPGDAIMLMAGMNPSSWTCICTKLQDNNGDGLFDRVFFEGAFNAGSWNGGPPLWFDLQAPLAAGRMKLRFENAGDKAVVEITNPVTLAVESFSASGITAFTFPITGKRFAIGHGGKPLFDNWSASTTVSTYGAGCKGSSNFVPTLESGSSPAAGGQLTVEIAKGMGGAPAIFLFGLNQTKAPIGMTGCDLLISPVLPPNFTLPLGGTTPGTGSLSVFGVLPASTAGITFTMQVFIVDSGVARGYSATNGLLVEIQ